MGPICSEQWADPELTLGHERHRFGCSPHWVTPSLESAGQLHVDASARGPFLDTFGSIP